MPKSATGESQVVLYTRDGKCLFMVLRNQQLMQSDLVDGGVFFVEARNYRGLPQFFENCLVGFIDDDGIGRLGVSYFIDYRNKVAHLWRLREGCMLDCACQTRTKQCKQRLCGFHERFEPHRHCFSSKESEKLFWFLNQLQPASYLVSSP